MTFSPETFMNTVFTEANDDKIIPCPAGEFAAQVVEIAPKTGIISKGDRAGEPWASLNIVWETVDAAATSATNRDKVRVRQSVMMDLTPQGGLDMSPGRNISLGRLRSALGLNVPGQPFSPSMMIGRSARISVGHRLDERDGVTVYADVRNAAPL